MKHEYWCESANSIAVFKRMTKPKIGQVVTFDKQKWEVWYVEQQDGECRARLEPYRESLK